MKKAFAEEIAELKKAFAEEKSEMQAAGAQSKPKPRSLLSRAGSRVASL